MPKIGVSKDSLKDLPALPNGIYDVRFDGFEPKFAKEKAGKERSINLRPKLVVINHPDPKINGRQVFTPLNTAFGPGLLDFTHFLGTPMTDDGDDMTLPGEFVPPDEPDPTKWSYIGPLMGQTGKLEIYTGEYNGKPQPGAIKRFFCRVPNCSDKHREQL